MIRIFTALIASAFVLLTAACCCTGEAKPPRLRELTQFQEIETTTVSEVQVTPTK
jgi:hypothetical protein